MELRQWAISILSADTLDQKLFIPDKLTDKEPGQPYLFKTPIRPPGLGFVKFARKGKLPAFHEHGQADHRAVCLHRFAGHELLAVEIMAFALLAFPEAPASFRKGLANTIIEEMWHVRIYQKRLLEMGTKLGDEPLNGRFWNLTKHLSSPIEYVSVMHLTLEMANLDFAPHYGASFERNGDLESAKLMQRIYEDEISHVSFGYGWLKRLKENKQESDYKTYLKAVDNILTPKRAKGFIYQEEPRKRAHLPDDWIQSLKKNQFSL